MTPGGEEIYSATLDKWEIENGEIDSTSKHAARKFKGPKPASWFPLSPSPPPLPALDVGLTVSKVPGGVWWRGRGVSGGPVPPSQGRELSWSEGCSGMGWAEP